MCGTTWVRRAILCSLFSTCAAVSQAAIVSQMIGDDDGFGGTQSRLVRRSYSSPGDAFYTVAFPLRLELPASSYEGTSGMDRLTSTEGPFQFVYNFILDLTSLEEIESAEFMIQFGSVGYDPGPESEPSGFGHANVQLDGINVGKLFTTAGPRGGLPGSHEEQVRQSTYNVKEYLQPGTQQSIQVTVGDDPYANKDQFAIDYVQLTAHGPLKVVQNPTISPSTPADNPISMQPEPSAFLVWAMLGVCLLSRRRR